MRHLHHDYGNRCAGIKKPKARSEPSVFTVTIKCWLGVVCAGGNVAAMAGPVCMEKFATRLIDAFVSVSAEIIALCLEQVCRETFAAILVVKAERGCKCGRRNSFL